MRKRSRLKFKSRSRRNFKKVALNISAALLCITAGFLTAMLVLPTFELPDLPLESEDPSGSSSVVSSAPSSDTSAPDPVIDRGIRAVYLPPSSVDSSEEITGHLTLFRNSGINAVILDVKDESGVLYYPSEIEMVKKVGNVSSVTTNYRQTVKRFQDAGFYVIGRVVCFKDNTMPRNKYNYRPYSVLTVLPDKNIHVNWYYNNIFWLDPYKEAARGYLYSVIGEAAMLGFDEIMLDELKFPDAGPTYMLDYGTQELSRSEILTEFINRSADIAHENNAKLSIKTSWKFLNGTATEESGQTFSLSDLNIDCFVPDFRITEVASSNRNIQIGATTVNAPFKNPVNLISALNLLAENGKTDGVVFRPYISATAPAGYNYAADEIKGQAAVFGSDECFNFVYFEKNGSYSADITDIG